MTKEVIQQAKFTDQDQADLVRLEQQMEDNKEGANLFFEAVAEIFEREIYLITHKNFKAYCSERWPGTFSTIERHLRGDQVRKQLLSDTSPRSEGQKAEAVDVIKALSGKALLESSKIKQAERLETILASNEAAKGQKITAKLIAKTAAKLAHKAIPKPQPEKRVDAWEATYGSSAPASKPEAIKGQRVTLEEFRVMLGSMGLNVPNTAVIYLRTGRDLIQVTSVKFNRNDNELVLS